MNPVIEKEKPCECGGVIQRFANVTRCSQCGAQPGRGYQGDSCPEGCDPRLTVSVAGIGGAGKRCNGCGRQW
jgi:hypothetical protein